MTALETPVLFIIFNRLDSTANVFSAIKKARPKKLYIAADGPRRDVPDDSRRCGETRDIVSNIDWECEVKTLFRNENLGGKHAVTNALNWFFSHEEEGIILEDDCLPCPDFFTFCAALLQHYREDTRVMHIAGTNLQFGKKRGDASYYFSRISSIWGWATWKRVWQNCDHEMRHFPRFEQEDQMINLFPSRKIADWITSVLRKVYEGKIQTWDFPFGFSILCNNGLCIVPNENLVSNIGFGAAATNTKNGNSIHSNIPVGRIDKIIHPTHFVPDAQADIFQLSLSAENK